MPMPYNDAIAVLTNPDKYKDILFWINIQWPYEHADDILWLSNKPHLHFVHDHITQMPVFEERLGKLDYSCTFRFINGNGIDLDGRLTKSASVTVALSDSSRNQQYFNFDENQIAMLMQGKSASLKKISNIEYEMVVDGISNSIFNSTINTSVTFRAGKIKLPFCIGSPKNVTPEIVSVSGSNVYYRYSHLPANGAGIPTIRENGVSKSVSTFARSTAEFSINSRPAGLITADVAIKDTLTVATAIQQFSNITAFDNTSDTQKNYPIGLFVPSSADITYGDLLRRLSQSAHIYISSTTGLGLNAATLGSANSSDFEITDHDIVDDSLKHIDTLPPKKAITIAYAVNYTPQDSTKLSSSVSDANVLLYSTAKKYVSGSNTFDSGTDSFISENEQNTSIAVDTLLLNEADATAELNYWLNRMNRTRFIYSMEIGLRAYAINVGKRVKLTLAEFNNVPKYGDVVRIIRDTSGFTSTIEVLI